MRIALSHPTTGHSHQVANVLYDRGALGTYFTSFNYPKGGGIERVVKSLPSRISDRLHRQMLRRRRTSVPPSHIELIPHIELMHRTAMKLTGRAFPREAYRAFDRSVARRLTDEYSSFYGFFNAALLSMRRMKALNRPVFMTMPICHWKTGRSLIRDEFNRWSLGASYIDPYPWVEGKHDHEMEEELELADFIVAGSEFVVDSLVDGGVPREKVGLIPSGVDASLYTPRPTGTHYHEARRHEQNRKFRIVSVGKLDLRKGTLDLVEAARRLSNNVEVKLLGRNGMPVELRHHLAVDNVECLGHLPFADVVRWLHWADALVFPTIFEGSSLASYEAMATGLPIITTKNCGSVVRDGQEGCIVPIRSPDRIVSAIENLIENEDIWLTMSENAKRRSSQFSWTVYGDTLFEELQRLGA